MSLTHLLLILAVVLLIFGPSRLPGLGKSVGDAIRGFKKGLNEDTSIDVTHSLQERERQEALRSQADANDPLAKSNSSKNKDRQNS